MSCVDCGKEDRVRSIVDGIDKELKAGTRRELILLQVWAGLREADIGFEEGVGLLHQELCRRSFAAGLAILSELRGVDPH
jgi:hypothetical protein